ncbi:MAG: hypothetical protein GY720_01690 [bacterium]|nr:hypothetical protein [bacterium]
MALTVLGGLADRLVALLHGASVDRSLAASRLLFTPYNPNTQWAASAIEPFPFEVVDGGPFKPLDKPSTMSATQIWKGHTLIVRIGFTPQPHAAFERMQQIQEMDADIYRTLQDPTSWTGTTGFAGVDLSEDGGDINEEDVEGSDEKGTPAVMWVLEIAVDLTYREDHS